MLRPPFLPGSWLCYRRLQRRSLLVSCRPSVQMHQEGKSERTWTSLTASTIKMMKTPPSCAAHGTVRRLSEPVRLCRLPFTSATNVASSRRHLPTPGALLYKSRILYFMSLRSPYPLLLHLHLHLHLCPRTTLYQQALQPKTFPPHPLLLFQLYLNSKTLGSTRSGAHEHEI